MTAAPFFTVVMATWGRGRHILPSIRSVLAQDHADFELIVAGDACTDDTEAVVRSLADPRLGWLNLTSRCGSQSGPNNAGIAASRGRVIAYLGHDDIWEPDHLSRLAALYRSDDPPDFGVSGLVMHLPHGLPGSEVMGIFADGAEIDRFFFPPSSFSHRRDVTDRIGPWGEPMELRAPVDEDLLLRAAAAGLRFRATGVITVHKFAAGHRYLSYVRHNSDEQEAMLVALASPDHPARVARLLDEAKAASNFMRPRRHSFDRYAPGALARRNAAGKGLHRFALMPLGKGVTLRHRKENGVLDWRNRPYFGLRRTKKSPQPRLLVPVTGGRARLRFLLVHRRAEAIGPVRLLVNGVPVTAEPRWVGNVLGFRFATCTADIDLYADQPTLLDLHLTEAQRPGPGHRGIAIGPLRLRPV